MATIKAILAALPIIKQVFDGFKAIGKWNRDRIREKINRADSPDDFSKL